MALEDDARRCCEDIESVRSDVERVRKAGSEDAKRHLAQLESKLERFVRDARDVPQKLESGIREGLEGLVTGWREGRDRLSAHLRLIDAKSTLASAQRLAKDQYYVAAESALTSALRQIQEASASLPAEDAHVNELVEKIQRAIVEIKEEGEAAGARLESVVAMNERLLAELER